MDQDIILCLETTTHRSSVCLIAEGKVIGEALLLDEGDATSKLTMAIQEVMIANSLELSHLKAVAVNFGPGSYTGLRLGLTVAKGLCFALNIPLIKTTTFEYLTENSILGFPHTEKHVVLVDARRSDAFCSLYHKTSGYLPIPQFATICSKWLEEHQLSNCAISGDFYDKIEKEVIERFSISDTKFRQEARLMAETIFNKYKSGTFSDLQSAIPLYIKPPNITTPKDR